MRILMDSAGSDRPQRRTALVGRELDWYKVEIDLLNIDNIYFDQMVDRIYAIQDSN